MRKRTKLQLSLVGVGVGLAAEMAFVGSFFAVDALAPTFLDTDTGVVVGLVALGATGVVALAGVGTSVVGLAWQPQPIGADEARGLVDQHNIELRAQLGLPPEGPTP